jgi:tetratricopeptide (TPR) repeat protein
MMTDSVCSMIRQGQLDLRAGSTERAVELLSAAMERFEDADGYASLADALFNEHEPEQALSALGRAIMLSPDEPRLWSKRGNLRLRLSDPSGALTDYGQSLKLDREQPPVYHARAMAYLQLANDAAAHRDLDMAVRLAPDNPRYHFFRGALHRQCGNHMNALVDLNRAIELRGDHARSYEERGLTLLANREFKAAAEDFSTALQLERTVDRLQFLGRAQLEMGHVRGAVLNFSAALSKDQDCVEARAARGLARAVMGEEEADRDLHLAEQAARDNPDVWLFIARARLHQEAYDEAAAAAGAAIEILPDSALAYRVRAAALEAAGELEAAEADLAAAMELEPGGARTCVRNAAQLRRLSRRRREQSGGSGGGATFNFSLRSNR